MHDTNAERVDARSGKLPYLEQSLDLHLGNTIHLFLALLAVLIIAAAAVAAVEIMINDFPRLWQQSSEYDALYQFIQDILLVAIAAELALLLLLHRTSAALEVVIFCEKNGYSRDFRLGAPSGHSGSRWAGYSQVLLLARETEIARKVDATSDIRVLKTLSAICHQKKYGRQLRQP